MSVSNVVHEGKSLSYRVQGNGGISARRRRGKTPDQGGNMKIEPRVPFVAYIVCSVPEGGHYVTRALGWEGNSPHAVCMQSRVSPRWRCRKPGSAGALWKQRRVCLSYPTGLATWREGGGPNIRLLLKGMLVDGYRFWFQMVI